MFLHRQDHGAIPASLRGCSYDTDQGEQLAVERGPRQ